MRDYQQNNYWQKYQRYFPKPYRISDADVVEEQYWSWRGSKLHLDIGRGLPELKKDSAVILLHGAGGHGRLLAPIAKAFNQQGYDTIALDLPGYGLTEAKSEHILFDRWVECCVDFVIERYQQTGKPSVLVGVSLGGMLAYCVAAKIQSLRFPVSPVVGLITSTLCDTRYEAVKKQFARFSWMTYFLPLIRCLPQAFKNVRLPIRWFSRMTLISNEAGLSKLVEQDPQGGGSRVPFAFLLSILDAKPDVEPEAFQLCPLLLIHPELDRMTPLNLSELFFSRIKTSKQLHVLKGCGHIPIEEPGVEDMTHVTLAFMAGR